MLKTNSQAGIVSYGAYIPQYRIKTETITEVYGKDPNVIKGGLGILEKAVPGKDEDTITNAVNSARQAFARWKSGSKINDIGAIYVGSESHPYAVKSTSATVGESLGISNFYTAADLEFACKAGTAAMQMVFSHVDANRITAGFAIGADTAQGAPGDALEYSAASAAAAFIIGSKNVIAKLIHTESYTTDTPDFWRREHKIYPSHGGRFTGEPAYFDHIISATKASLKSTNSKIEEFDHVVLHMPNAKFPQAAAKILGVTNDQLKTGFTVPLLGNSYSACSLIGFAKVLDNAKPKQKILLTSYGSGAASDTFIFEVTDEILNYKKNYEKFDYDKTVQDQIDKKVYLNYGQYVNHTHKLKS